MNWWIFLFFIFLLIFLYLHFLEEKKIGKNLEVLEMDYVDNHYLQENCRTKQPIFFALKNGFILADSHALCTFDLKEFVYTFGKLKVSLYESSSQYQRVFLKDAYKSFILSSSQEEEKTEQTGKTEEIEKIEQIGKNVCWSEDNNEIIYDTPLYRHFHYCDTFLAPFSTVNTYYDMILGPSGVTTPLRYHRRHSYFLFVMQGEITVRLTPFKNTSILGDKTVSRNDYWYIDPEIRAEQVEETVPFVDVYVFTGNCLFVPPYWWHQINFHTDAQMAVFMYDNIMNTMLLKMESLSNRFILQL